MSMDEVKWKDMLEHFEVFQRCMEVYDERREAYNDVWKNYGALSNLLQAARKVDRLMEIFWFNEGDIPALHKDVIDDALDGINYLTFFVRNATSGNIVGEQVNRPEAPTPLRREQT